jgi:hypothetical protein
MPRIMPHEHILGIVVTKKSVGIATVEVVGRWNYIPAACENSSSVFYSLSCGLQTRTRLHLEIIALWHRLAVLERKFPTRPKLSWADRRLWVALSRLWSDWRSSLVIVKPGTVVG